MAPWHSDYTGRQIYYQSLRGPREDFLTIRDYLWRWDTDWFWCSRPFGVQKPGDPRRCGRAGTAARTCTVRWSPSTAGTGCPTRLDRAAAGSRRARTVIQDVEIPVEPGRGVPPLLRRPRSA